MRYLLAFLLALSLLFAAAAPATASPFTPISGGQAELLEDVDGSEFVAEEATTTGEYSASAVPKYTPAGWEWAVNTYGRSFWAYECGNITFSYGPTVTGAAAEATRSTCHIRADLPKMNNATGEAVVGLAVHEVGHLQGCPHSLNTNSIMQAQVSYRLGKGVMDYVNARYPAVTSCY